MKVAVVGGHFSPALEVIKELEKDEIIFLGRKFVFEGSEVESLEYREIKKRNIPFYNLSSARLQRSFSKHTIPSLFKLPKGCKEAFSILKKEKPDVVVSFGGYLSVPVGLSAFALRIPLVIHEQTFNAGLANKILAKFATKICISWPSSATLFPHEKLVLTGNPVRFRELNALKDKFFDKSKEPFVYVTGGSAGSHAINVIVERSLPTLLKSFKVLHQTGDAVEYNDFNRLSVLRDSLEKKENYMVAKFINPSEVGSVLARADIIVGRSGINIVSELFLNEKPGLFIPLPTGQKNEQLTNAQMAKKLGMARVLLQKDATTEQFIKDLTEIAENIKSYRENAKKGKEMIIADAAKRIVIQLKYVVKKKSP